MRTRTWTTWLACAAIAMLMVACGGGGGSSGSGSAPSGGAGSGSGGSAGSGGSGAVATSYTLVLNQTSGKVAVGDTMPLTASVVDNLGNDVTGSTTFAWSTVNSSIAVVANASVPGGAVVTGVGLGIANISVVATVTGANNATTVLPQASTTITVVAPGSRTYSLALPYPSLSMTDGQTLRVTASLIDSDGADRSASATGWTWRSTTSAVQAAGVANVGVLLGVNGGSTVALSVVSVQVTAPDGSTLTGAFPVSVFPTGVSSYRLVLSQNGSQINALSVLNGFPQTYLSQVVRSDGNDSTPDFTGLWTFTTTSPSLLVLPDSSTRLTTVSTGRPNGASPLQSILSEMASSLTLSAKPRATLFVTEQPTWALVYNGPQPLVVNRLAGATIAVQLMHRGVDEGITGCGTSWAWSTTSSNIVVAQSVLAPNSASILPTAAGPFSVTATCTAGVEAMPLSITIPGTAQ